MTGELMIEFLPGSHAARVIASVPGSDAIGQSYDVFGYYANPKSVKKELFNFGDQEEVEVLGNIWLLSTDFKLVSINGTSNSTVLARTKDHYSQQLAASVKVTGGSTFFSATVESDFSHGFTSQTDSTYNSIIVTVEKWKLSLKDNIKLLRPKMKPEFKSALATMAPVQLFEAYGTHFLGEVLVGGRANYVSVTKTSVFESETKLRAAAEASFSKVSTGGRGSVSNEQEVKKFQENSSTSLYALGGNALSNIQDSGEYKAWLNSIDTRPVFSGFTVDSLVPLWELADTENRRQQLKLATQKFVPSYITRTALVGLAVISAAVSSVSPPYLYTKINYDLNKGAGGKFVYVCYKQAKISVAGNAADPKPITGIHIAVGDNWNPSIPAGYVKVSKDINEGAGGKFMFLCYSDRPDKAEEGLPIRSICVIGGKNSVQAPYGFTKIDVDLNKGSGGDFIYLCYSRHLDGV